MDGTSYFPSRPEMEAEPRHVRRADRAAVRYGCRWTATRPRGRADGARFEVETTDGDYTCRTLVIAVGVAEPYHPAGVGHGARLPLRRRPPGRDLRRPAGVHHRQAELRVRAGQRPAAVGAPARPRVAVEGEAVGRHEVAGRGPGALRPAVRGPRPGRRRVGPRRGDRPDRAPDGDGALAVRLRPDRRRRRHRVEVDEVISATGFVCPLLDLPDLGVATFGQPAAGPDAVVGERDRARHLLRGHDRAGRRRGCRSTACRRTPGRSTGRATTPGCWPAQIARDAVRGHRAAADRRRPTAATRSSRELARHPSCSTSAATWPGSIALIRDGPRDEGVLPLRRSRRGGDDGAGDAIAVTLEADGSGAIYPVVYVRRAGSVRSG